MLHGMNERRDDDTVDLRVKNLSTIRIAANAVRTKLRKFIDIMRHYIFAHCASKRVTVFHVQSAK